MNLRDPDGDEPFVEAQRERDRRDREDAKADAEIDNHLDAVLRAAGSALRHYTMQKSRDDMRAAMRVAMQKGGA